MSLKIELKPGERFILGDSVITNGNHRAHLFIAGTAPVLREKDIMTAESADTPCKKIYLAVQLMYLSEKPEEHRDTYFKLVEDVMAAAPSTFDHIDRINNRILTGAFYKALREARSLITYEEELLGHAKRGTGLQSGGQDNR